MTVVPADMIHPAEGPTTFTLIFLGERKTPDDLSRSTLEAFTIFQITLLAIYLSLRKLSVDSLPPNVVSEFIVLLLGMPVLYLSGTYASSRFIPSEMVIVY